MDSGDNNDPCSCPWEFRKCPLSCGSVPPPTPHPTTVIPAQLGPGVRLASSAASAFVSRCPEHRAGGRKHKPAGSCWEELLVQRRGG